MSKNENKQRALHVAEMLHIATEALLKKEGKTFDDLAKVQPQHFLRENSTWMSSYCMLCSTESMAEENRKARRTSRWISIISLVFSIVAIASSAVAIYSSYFWQKEQIPLLKQIVENTQQDKVIK